MLQGAMGTTKTFVGRCLKTRMKVKYLLAINFENFSFYVPPRFNFVFDWGKKMGKGFKDFNGRFYLSVWDNNVELDEKFISIRMQIFIVESQIRTNFCE